MLTNPAGMTRLEKTQFMFAGQGLYGVVQFTPNSLTSPSLGTNNGGNPIGFLPGGSLFFVWSASENLKFGLGAYSNFGLAESYASDWVGRYYVQSATLLGLSMMPAAAYRVLPWLSLGASANIMFGILKDTVAVNGILPSAPDGSLKVDTNAWGFGGEFGVLFEIAKGSRIGVTYNTPVSLNFGGTPSGNNLPGVLLRFEQPLSLGLQDPQGVMVSFYQEITPGFALLGNVGWQNWANFGKVDISIGDTGQASATVNVNYKDTWHAALGAQIRVAEGWLLSTGVSYDSSMISDAQRTPSLPVGSALRFAAGIQHPVSESVELGFAYEFLWGGTLPMDQNRGPSVRANRRRLREHLPQLLRAQRQLEALAGDGRAHEGVPARRRSAPRGPGSAGRGTVRRRREAVLCGGEARGWARRALPPRAQGGGLARVQGEARRLGPEGPEHPRGVQSGVRGRLRPPL